MSIKPVPSAFLLRTLRQLAISPRHPRPHHILPCATPSTSRNFTTTPHLPLPPSSSALTTRDRGPESTEDTQTDFATADIFSRTPPPTNGIDACLPDGFHLDNGVKITGGDGLMLVAGEAFAWRPWGGGTPANVLPSTPPRSAGNGASSPSGSNKREVGLVNKKGQWEIPEQGGLEERAWGLLERVWPRPEMLILGLGSMTRPLSPATRRRLSELGIRVDVQDTRNAAAQFNLLATERGVGNIAAALVPMGREN